MTSSTVKMTTTTTTTTTTITMKATIHPETNQAVNSLSHHILTCRICRRLVAASSSKCSSKFSCSISRNILCKRPPLLSTNTCYNNNNNSSISQQLAIQRWQTTWPISWRVSQALYPVVCHRRPSTQAK